MGLLVSLFTFVILVFFPLGQIMRFDNGKGIAVTGFDIGVIALLIIWSIWLFFKENKKIPSFIFPLSLFVLVGSLGIVLSSKGLLWYQEVTAFLYAIRFGMYVSIAWVIASFPKTFQRKIPSIFFVSGLIILIGGYIQYFFYPGLRNLLYEGWDEHFYRMFSSFFDPNFLGIFFVLYILLILYLFLKARSKLSKLLYVIVGLASIGGLFLTYSRNSYMICIVTLPIFLVLYGMKKWVVGGLVGVILVLGIIFLLFVRHGEGTNILRTVSTVSRIENIQGGITIFSQSPFLGVGFDAYRYAQRRMGYLAGNTWETGHNGGGVNNSYVFVLATTGVIGFALFLWLLWTFLIVGWSTRKSHPLAILAFSSLIGLLVGSFLENGFFYPALLFWVMVFQGLLIEVNS